MRLALAQGRRGWAGPFPIRPWARSCFAATGCSGAGVPGPSGGLTPRRWRSSDAVRRFGARAVRGASMAVTLEPCCHVGRTGPCTEAIIEAGLRRVFVGHATHTRKCRGAGCAGCVAAGLEVSVGVLEEECRRLHRGFLSVCERGTALREPEARQHPGRAHRDRGRGVALDHRRGVAGRGPPAARPHGRRPGRIGDRARRRSGAHGPPKRPRRAPPGAGPGRLASARSGRRRGFFGAKLRERGYSARRRRRRESGGRSSDAGARLLDVRAPGSLPRSRHARCRCWRAPG